MRGRGAIPLALASFLSVLMMCEGDGGWDRMISSRFWSFHPIRCLTASTYASLNPRASLLLRVNQFFPPRPSKASHRTHAHAHA
jgi:hypothetical protein